MTGYFISFEGGEGSGKSTQIKLLHQAFERAGLATVITREPGGSPGAEAIRNLLVNGAADAWDAEAETLLFYAARLEHVHKVIRPALSAGKSVLCDRFADSTRVYQGIARHVSENYVLSLHRLTLGDFMPDLTLILDMPPEEGLKRAQARGNTENRFESLGLEFHQRIRNGFLSVAKEAPKRCAVIDATRTIEQVQRDIVIAIKEKLGLTL